MHFTASIGPATRATTDGSWEGTERLQVQIVDNYTSGTPQWSDGTQQTYTVTVGGVMTKIDETDAFWQANGEVKAIRAWYDADNSSATTLSDDHSVMTDQSGDGYAQSDFLFAQQTAKYPNGNSSVSLNFYHQVAKVNVNILKGDETPAGLSITGLTIGGIATSGTFTAPALGGTTTTPLGTWSVTEQNQNITPHAGTATGGNTLATYEALVIPQTVNGNTQLFTIAAIGYSDFVYTPTEEITWQPGMEYTYNITIKGSGLEVSTSQRIGWTEGSTGSGSVTFIDITPSNENQTLELKNGDVVNINGNGTTTTGKFTLNISTGNTATINLNNINMRQETSAQDNYAFTINGGGSLVFRLNGTENIIEGFNAGISNNLLSIATDPATDISIIGPGTLNIKGSNVYAGIVTGSNKNITIEDATLNLDYHFQRGSLLGAGAAIGSGPQQICGDITITRSDISIKVESSVSDSQDIWYGAAIGSGINGKCGNINITLKEGQDKDTFLGKISVEHQSYGPLTDDQKVGAGLYSLGCGTVTWYDSNGNKIE